MEVMYVRKSGPLRGRVSIEGSKNSCLAIMAATLLGNGRFVLKSVPDITDVHCLADILEQIGATVEYSEGTMTIDVGEIRQTKLDSEVDTFRASVILIGPLLARCGTVSTYLPGGCRIGARPIDLHIKALVALGAEIFVKENNIQATANKLKACKIVLGFPSVGATENAMMAATLAEGTTLIEHAAREPCIQDLAVFLNKMGADVRGAGTDTITIHGVTGLSGTQHTVIPDRIEAATYMAAAAISNGDVVVDNVIPSHLESFITAIENAGCVVTTTDKSIRVIGPNVIKPIEFETGVFPGIPTDTQPLLMAIMTIAKGKSKITETIFENRLLHVSELKKLGADISVQGCTATIKGIRELQGNEVQITDLRSGGALVLCGLVADGTTILHQVQHIRRGYANMEKKFRSIGGHIESINTSSPFNPTYL